MNQPQTSKISHLNKQQVNKTNSSISPLLNYQQFGDSGEHIVLIHGLFGSLENLNMVAKPLSKNFRVTSVDVRNHGTSFHHNDMDYPALAHDIITLLNHLTIEKCHLLGHSMGGKIAMQTALSYPDYIDKLIVADIAPIAYPAHHQQIIKGLQSFNFNEITSRKAADTQLANYVDDASIRQFLLRNFISKNDQASFKCNVGNIANCYPQIMSAIESSCPYQGKTLFIKGGNSNYILAEHQSAIAALFPSSKAKIIQNAGHWLHAEKPVAFNKIVQDFLSA